MNDFVRQLEIPPVYWSRIEYDIKKPSKDELIRKAAEILGISADGAFVGASRLPPDICDDVGSLVRICCRDVTERKRMAVLTLDYRCCDRKRPLYIKHIEVERIAATVRQQPAADGIDAVSFDALWQISSMETNDIDFALEVSTDYAVHDEQSSHIFGVCEFDPAMPDAAMVSISPVGESLSELLALSTLAHELGHTVFDAPGWAVQGSKGPGLLDDIEPTMQRAYRTTTPDNDHPSKSLSVKPVTEGHFAELRANEFMGSLLMPHQRIIAAVEELALQHDITIHRHPSTDPGHPGMALHIKANDDPGVSEMDRFEKALATRFGANPRFIRVCLNRYGLTAQEATMR